MASLATRSFSSAGSSARIAARVDAVSVLRSAKPSRE